MRTAGPMLPVRAAATVLATLLAAGGLAPLPARADDRPSPVPPDRRDAVAKEIRDLFTEQDKVSEYPLPQLDENAMKDLLDGKIVRLQMKWVLPSGTDEKGEQEGRERRRVLAFYLFPNPRDVVWVSAMDPHFIGNDRLSEARLEKHGTVSIWYQFMDPPWPVKNRQWVIRVEKPVKIAEATHDRIWEQDWRLADNGKQIALEATAAGRVPGVPLKRAMDSRYLEENVGAWTCFSLGDDLTLLAYQLTVVMGGWIPDRLAAHFAKGALEQLMKSVEANTKKIRAHYNSNHEPILGGDGRPVPFFSQAPPSGEKTAKDGGTDEKSDTDSVE